jgi:hypothetical protein
VLNRVAVKSP